MIGALAQIGRIKRIHVNRHVIASNRKHGQNEPVLRVKMGRDNFKGHEVEINGPSVVIYSPDKPLSCGATLWIETTASVEVF